MTRMSTAIGNGFMDARRMVEYKETHGVPLADSALDILLEK